MPKCILYTSFISKILSGITEQTTQQTSVFLLIHHTYEVVTDRVSFVISSPQLSVVVRPTNFPLRELGLTDASLGPKRGMFDTLKPVY